MAVNAISNLVAALNARLDVEESRYKRTTFQARNLEIPSSFDSNSVKNGLLNLAKKCSFKKCVLFCDVGPFREGKPISSHIFWLRLEKIWNVGQQGIVPLSPFITHSSHSPKLIYGAGQHPLANRFWKSSVKSLMVPLVLD